MTEAALAAAACIGVWALSMGIPGFGGYVRYMTFSLIAIIGARHGGKWSLAACAVSSVGIGLLLGPREFLVCLLLGTPIAILLPMMERRMAPALWWALTSAVYALAITCLAYALAALYGSNLREFVSAAASANYAALSGVWARTHVEPDWLAASAARHAWVIVALIGIACGVMMYLISVVPYKIGLRILDRTRRR